MLISFSVSNYRSFGDEVTLNMVANNKLTEHPGHLVPIGKTGRQLVRCGLLYGANASGKSNLVKAMAYAQRMIASSHSNLSPLDAFRFRDGMAKRPSTFEFRFLVDDDVFVYGFDIIGNEIQSEWLVVLDGEREVEIFQRNAEGQIEVGRGVGKKFSGDPELKKVLDILKQLSVRRDQLFLNRIGGLPQEIQGPTIRSVIGWLTEDLLILEPQHHDQQIMDRLYSEPALRTFVGQFLDHVGTGITGLEFEESRRECSEAEREFYRQFESHHGARHRPAPYRDVFVHPEHPDEVVSRHLVAAHRGGKLPFSEESDGTQQLLHYLPVLSNPKTQSRVVVIDEIDRSLHPLLCWELIQFFSESSPGARRQMVVTTHETHLLNVELLRRDEYWFVEKDRHQQSQLVPLTEFNIRNDLQLRKGYLQGRFGGIPVVGDLTALQQLLDSSADEAADAPQKAAAHSR